MEMKLDYSDISFQNNGKLKLLIIVGTRPEIIRLAAVINKCRKYFDCILAHTGQNYDYNLNGVFFHDLQLEDPEVYLNAVGKDLGETMGNIIAKSYQLMVEIQPDAVLVLGDTNSCLSVSAQSGCISPSSIWKPAIAAKMSACRKRPTAASWILSPMSIWPILSMRGSISMSVACPRSGPM